MFVVPSRLFCLPRLSAFYSSQCNLNHCPNPPQATHPHTHISQKQDVKDSPEEAARAAPQALWLCQRLEAAPDGWPDAVDGALEAFEAAHGRRATYTVCYY